jgi:hypothetical protein
MLWAAVRGQSEPSGDMLLAAVREQCEPHVQYPQKKLRRKKKCATFLNTDPGGCDSTL